MKTDEDRDRQTGNFRVEEFRLPVLSGMIAPPKAALVQPASIPLTVQVNYGNGGGAAGLPVRISAQLRPVEAPPGIGIDHYPGFMFRGPSKNAAQDSNIFDEDYVGENDAGDGDSPIATASHDNSLIADKVPVVLDKSGNGSVNLTKLPHSDDTKELVVEATYADPNGEIQTLSQTLPVWPSAVVLGIKTDNWVSVHQKMATQVIALDTQGKPRAGQHVAIRGLLHRTTTTRKRLVGGFYSYDNEHANVDLGELCSGTADGARTDVLRTRSPARRPGRARRKRRRRRRAYRSRGCHRVRNAARRSLVRWRER